MGEKITRAGLVLCGGEMARYLSSWFVGVMASPFSFSAESGAEDGGNLLANPFPASARYATVNNEGEARD